MAADVTSVVRILGGYKDDPAVGSESGNSTVLITRDLLGGGGGGLSSKLDSQELDLDLKVPDGWEKRLDLKVSLFVFFLGELWFRCFSRENFRFSILGMFGVGKLREKRITEEGKFEACFNKFLRILTGVIFSNFRFFPTLFSIKNGIWRQIFPYN